MVACDQSWICSKPSNTYHINPYQLISVHIRESWDGFFLHGEISIHLQQAFPIGRRSWTKSMAPQNAKFAGNELEVAPVVMTVMFAPPNTTCPGSTICEVCHGPRHRRGQPRSGHALGRRKTGPSLCLRGFFPNQEPPPWARGGGKSPAADPESQHCGFARAWQGSRPSAQGAPPQRSLYACSFKYGYYIQTYKEFPDRYLYDI